MSAPRSTSASRLWRSSGAAVFALAGWVAHAPLAHAGQPTPIIKLTASSVWADIDATAVKGRPCRLAWSDDRATLYLQTVEGDTRESLAFHHYLIRKGEKPARLDTQPPWADVYWKWKSAKSLAGDPQLAISVDTSREVTDNLNGTAADKTVFLTDSPIGVTGQALMLAKQTGPTRTVNRLLFKGHIVGEFVDELIVPGYTFGWSPEDMRKIAFRTQSGRLAIMDDEGQTDVVAETSDVLLPAWSDDGAAIAYLERARRRFSVRVLEVLGR